MKRTKRILAILLAAAMLLLAGCSGSAPSSSQDAAPSEQSTSETPGSTDSTGSAEADAYPNKPLTIIVNSGAGGASDSTMRALAVYLEKYMGVTVTVMNVTGGSGWIGWNQCLTAPADGYTIVTSNAHTIFSYYNKETANDRTIDDFDVLCNIVSDKGVVAVRSADERFKDVNDLKDLVEYLKANPNEEFLGGVGPAGGDDHMRLLMLCNEAGLTNVTPVHSAGGTSEAKPTFLGGHVDIYFGNVGDTSAEYESGEIKVLGVTDQSRSSFMPDVPTAEELGFPVYSSSSRGISTALGTDPAVREKLMGYLKQALSDPEFLAQMDAMGFEMDYIEGDALKDFMKKNEDGIVSILDLLGWA